MPTSLTNQQTTQNSDRQKAEESMRQIQLIVDNSYDAIIGETFGGIITSWNGGATRMFGYTASEMMGKSTLQMLPPEMQNELPGQLKKIQKGEVIADYDTIRIRKDGSRLNVAISMSPVKDEAGKLVGASVVERDISTRKKSEESMRQIQLVVDNSYDALIGTDLKGIITSWSGGATRMFGFTPIEAIGKSSAILNPPELKDEVQIMLDKVATGAPVVDYDSVRIRKDGTKFDVSFSTAAIQTKDGAMIGVSSVIRDNTVRKKAQESMRQIQLVVDNSFDAIIGESLEGNITSWNGGAARMFGYTAEEIVGKSILTLYPPESKEELALLLTKIKSGEIVADHDAVRVRKDGTKIDIALSISPIKDRGGKITGASIVYRDITEREKSEAHVKELNEVRNKFIEIISHQLRTPLTSINWGLESILNGDYGKLEDVQHKFLQATHSASTEITKRIGSLLSAMDIEEGRMKYEMEDVDLTSLCAGIANEAATKCVLKELTFTYTPPANTIPIFKGDNEKIRTATNILLENAIGYTKEKGKITMSLAQKGGMAHLEVIDTGIGIPKGEQPRVFTRFFRASNSPVMETDAFGIGLFIAKNYIEQHKGKIGFKSEEGKGSTFWFEVPLSGTNP